MCGKKPLQKTFVSLNACKRYINGGRHGRGNVRVRFRGTPPSCGIFVPAPGDSARSMHIELVEQHFKEEKAVG